ncbi:MAG: hypothetical protein FWE08_06945 [Oscillospiraceae bacterium]|nr:hypothetical protein [Oscillospiraceae bacterium]
MEALTNLQQLLIQAGGTVIIIGLVIIGVKIMAAKSIMKALPMLIPIALAILFITMPNQTLGWIQGILQSIFG